MPIQTKVGYTYDYVEIQAAYVWLHTDDKGKKSLTFANDLEDIGDYDNSNYPVDLDLDDLTLEQATDLLNMVRLRDGALGAYCLPSLTPKGPIPNPKGEEEEEDPD